MSSIKNKERKKKEKKHINDKISEFKYEESLENPEIKKTTAVDEILKHREEFLKNYGEFAILPNIQVFISMIENDLLDLLSDSSDGQKTKELAIYEKNRVKILKQLPQIPNAEKIKKFILQIEDILEDEEEKPLSLLAKCKNLALEELILQSTNFSINGFGVFFESARNIESIKKLTLFLKAGKKDLELLEKFTKCAENLKNLEFLSINCGFFSETTYSDFFSSLKNKVKVKITFDQSQGEIDFNNFQIPKPHELQSLSLRNLDFDDQKLRTFFDKIDDKSFLKEINLWKILDLKGPFLEYLSKIDNLESFSSFSISECPNLSLEVLENFLQSSKCENLEILNLQSYLRKFQVDVLIRIFSSKPRLTRLSLPSIDFFKSDDWMNLFKSTNFKEVKKLELWNSTEINLKVLDQLCLQEEESFNKLEYIDLYNTGLTDEAFNFLPKLDNLKSMDLGENNFSFKSTELSKFLKSPNFKQLEWMNLYGIDSSKLVKELNQLTEDVNLRNIDAEYKNNDILEIIKNPHLKNLNIQNAISSVCVGNSLLKAFIDQGNYLKKIWYLNRVTNNDVKIQTDQIKTKTILAFVSSENLNPFFKKNDFLNMVKDAVTNEVLKGMSANLYFMRFLFELDLKDFNLITSDGVSSILQSPYISPYFDVSGLLQSLTMQKKEDLLQYLDRFTKIKKLDISGYSLTQINDPNHPFLKFFTRSKFPNLRDLNLSNTDLDNALFDKLFPKTSDSLLNGLLYLSLAYNKHIKSEAFKNFFRKINDDNKLMGLDLDGCAIENENLKDLYDSHLSKNLEYLSISKCSSIDHIGMQHLLDLHNKKKKLRFMNIYRDYKGLIELDIKDKKFIIYRPTRVQLYKIQKILVNNIKQNLSENERNELNNLRYSVTDRLLKEFLKEEPRIKHFHTLDFTKCPISSAGVKAIAKEKNLKMLTCLKINKTLIDDEGVEQIAKINNLKVLEIEGCPEITKLSLKHLLNAKNFHPDFNPEDILRCYADLIDKDVIDDISRSIYRKKIGLLSLKTNSNLDIVCLDKLLDLEKDNQKLELELNLDQILSININEITDDLLRKLSECKILKTINFLEILQPQPNEENLGQEKKYVTKEGLIRLIKSEFLSEDFDLQKLIPLVLNLIDDDVLKAISKSNCFHKFQYTSALKDCKEKKESEIPKDKEEEKKEEPEKEEKKEQLANPGEQKKNVTEEGLWHLSLSPNENFNIQDLMNDFGDMITSSFIKNMVQQPYFRKLKKLNLSSCTQLKDDDLCLIIKASNENFDLEQFVSEDSLPNKETSLVTNNVVKAISKSAYIKSRYKKESKSKNFRENDFKRFNFNVKNYPKVDYAINYLIQARASQVRHYAVYLETYTAYLSSESLEVMRNDIINYKKFNQAMIKKKESKKELEKDYSNPYVNEEKIVEALSGIKTLKFSTNKYIYDHNIKASLVEAFENFQNQNDLNLDSKTIKYYVRQIGETQAENNTPESFDKKHEILLDLIKECKNLEVINLDSLNLGDDFLKKFSIYISENPSNLKNLKIFELKNNFRITSVGLKYLFCSIISRTAVLQTITVQNETIEKTSSDINNFVSMGLKGMIDNNIAYNSRELKAIYKKYWQKAQSALEDKNNENDYLEEEINEEKKELKKDKEKPDEFIDELSENKDKVALKIQESRQIENNKKGYQDISGKGFCCLRFRIFLKFLFSARTMQILGIYFLIFPVLTFHYLEKFIFMIPKALSQCGTWMREHKPCNIIIIPFAACWKGFEKLYDCFGNCIKLPGIKSKNEKKQDQNKREVEHKKRFDDKKETKNKKTEVVEKEEVDEEEKWQREEQEEIDEIGPESKEDEDKLEDEKSQLEKNKDMKVLHIEIPAKKKNKVTPEMLNDKGMSFTPTTTVTLASHSVTEKMGCCQKFKNSLKRLFSCLSCLKIQRGRGDAFEEELKMRYSRCQMAIEEDVLIEASIKRAKMRESTTMKGKTTIIEANSPTKGSPLNKEKNKKSLVNFASYFYFDESLIKVNDVLCGSLNSIKVPGQVKANQISMVDQKSEENQGLLVPTSPNTPYVTNMQQIQLVQGNIKTPFLFITKLNWIIFFDFIVFYFLVVFYLLYVKLVLHDDASLFLQVPYFGYAFFCFILELILCWEVTSIINNKDLVSVYDSTIISNLITSQTSKYDTFTNVTFVLSNLVYNYETQEYEAKNGVFIASLVFVGINILLNFKNFLSYVWKNLIKTSKKTKYHSSKNINTFSKLCFQFEFQSLGRLLDKFSTNSAKKYSYWFLPKMLYNVYIPTIITATFGRLLIEDFPLLIIQLYVAINNGVFNFTYIASLCSTGLALFMTLHTAWNVKPSIFNRELFEKYLKKTIDVKKEMEEKKMENENQNLGRNMYVEEKNEELEKVEIEIKSEEDRLAEVNFDPKVLIIQKEQASKSIVDGKNKGYLRKENQKMNG